MLVNAVGVLHGAYTHECGLKLWNQVITANLTGAFLVTRAALPVLLDRGREVVVNLSNTPASFSTLMAAYSASKCGMEALAHSIA